MNASHDPNGPWALESEITPGVVERRALLWLPAGALGGLALARRAGTLGAGVRGPGGLAWEEFIATCEPVAAALVDDRSREGQDAYVLSIAALAARVTALPDTPLSAFAGLDPAVRFGIAHRGKPFFCVQWSLEPGAELPAHCHPQGVVCTLAASGEARLRHFEVSEGAPAYDSGSDERFEIRETKSVLLRKGVVSTLTAVRDNLHTFRAGPEGATGVDVTTMLGGDGSFSFLDVSAGPRDAERGTFDARWIGSKL